MKLLMFSVGGGAERAGLLRGEEVVDLGVGDILEGLEVARRGVTAGAAVHRLADARVGPLVRRAPSFRDGFAFEEHVANARRNRGAEVPPEWYQVAAFYFSNPSAFLGPGEPVAYPRASQALDLEFEIGILIARDGIDLGGAAAEEVIAGYTILNDWSARDVQMVEMGVGLGPAKGKDFATSIGPYLVTPDELADRRREGGRYDLAMTWRLNGVEMMRGSFATMHYPFPALIERMSADAWLRRGDVIGSGTVGRGCLLEWGAARERYLAPGDVVELEVERLGVLVCPVGPPRGVGGA
jgi:fumarylacetoacetate (FAA) hydrolase